MVVSKETKALWKHWVAGGRGWTFPAPPDEKKLKKVVDSLKMTCYNLGKEKAKGAFSRQAERQKEGRPWRRRTRWPAPSPCRTLSHCSPMTRRSARCWARCSRPSRSPARSPTRPPKFAWRMRSWRRTCATLSSATARPSMLSGLRSMCAASWPRRRPQPSPVLAWSWASSPSWSMVGTSPTPSCRRCP